MKLYELTWGVFPRRVTIYLAEKGISGIERIPLDFMRGENREAAHLARNPAGTVPVLEISQDVYVRQSTAILEYLEELYPLPNMIGETPLARAFTRDLMSLINDATIAFGIYLMLGNPLFSGRVEQKPGAGVPAWDYYRQRMSILNQLVKDGDFIAGCRPTIADCALASLIGFAKGLYGVSIPPDCKRLEFWYERFSARPSATPIEYPAELVAIAQSQQGNDNAGQHLL